MAILPSLPTVLVVDDDDDLRAVLCEVLESEGFHVIGVSDGTSALAASQAAALDLAVIDRHHPGPNGPALVAELRQRHPGLQVLVISGTGMEALPGVQNLGKPFSMSELVAALERLRRTPTKSAG